MNILVCLKQILDPEIPARDFRVDPARREAERGAANLVTNIFCENALETALQLRERADGKLQVRRQTDSGWEVIEAEPPVVVTVTNDEHNVPRIPKVRDVMMSYRQPLVTWTLADLDIDVDEVRAGNTYYEVVDLFIPQKETRCEFVVGDTLDEKVEAFARRIVEVTSAAL